jgi:integrase
MTCNYLVAVISRSAQARSPKNWFKPTLRKAGLSGLTIHDLQHTFGSLLLDAGAPLADVSEQMGHTSTVQHSTGLHPQFAEDAGS